MKKLLVFLCCQLLVVTCMFAQDNARLIDTNLGLTAIVESEPTPGWLNFKASENVNPATIFQVYKSEFGLGIDDEMVLMNNFTDGYGTEHFMYNQHYKGIAIENAKFDVVSNTGNAYKGRGKLISSFGAVNTSPLYSYSAALTYAKNHLDPSKAWVDHSPSSDLIIAKFNNGLYRLAYKFELSYGDSEGYTVYVNARNSTEINSYSSLSYACVEQNMNSVLSFADLTGNNIDKVIDEMVCTENINGYDVYKDIDREITLLYEDNMLDFIQGNGQLEATPILESGNNNYYTTQEQISSLTDCPNNATFVGKCDNFVNGKSAYFLASFAHDYFKESIGNCDAAASPLSFQELNILLTSESEAGSFYNHNNNNTLALLNANSNTDVVLHEYTHYINNTVLSIFGYGLNFYGGVEGDKITLGLGESFADIFAIMINRKLLKAYVYGQTDPETNETFTFDDPNWKYTHRNFTHSICNELNEVLNFTSIHKIGQLQNQWFQQLIDGATASGSVCYEVDVLPLSDDPAEAWEIAENIVLQNFSYNLFGIISYEDARQGSIEAAIELYPGNERVLKSVIDAWHNLEVGVSYSDYIANTNINSLLFEPTEVIEAGQTITWTPGSKYRVSGILKVNGTLIIESSTVYFANENSGIIVEKGGKLIINFATLKRNDCNGNGLWRGIQVLGDPTIPHPTSYNIDNTYDHWGVADLTNAFIEDAIIGVRASSISSVDLDLDGTPADGDYGGGIVRIDRGNFRNNLKSIHLAASKQNSLTGNLNFINSCEMKIDKSLPNIDMEHDPQFWPGLPAQYLNEVEHIYLHGAQNVNITNSYFVSSIDHVTGIYCTNCSGIIGEESESLSNHFINLYKGISIFEYSSGIALNVINNNFSQVNKGITINTAPFTTIQKNSFSINSPNNSDDSYGIFSYYSEGCDINNNTFSTNTHNSTETRGIVLVNSNGVSGDKTLLNANTFTSYSGTGSFKSAIEIEGDNRNCQLQCNIFEVDNAADWRFVYNGTQPTLFDEQGTDPTTFGTEENVNESFSTTWYRNSSGSRNGYDISIDNYGNSTTDKITLYPDTEESSPNYIYDPNNQYEEDGYQKGISFDCESLIEGLIDDPPPPSTNCITHRYEMKNYARQPIYSEYLVEYLDCHNTVWADQILVGNYMSTQQLAKARTTLENIPLDSEENREFYETYDEALTYLENGQSAGKAAVAMQTLKEIAGPVNPKKRAGKRSAMAESFLAATNGTNFTRSALSGKKSTAQSTTANDSNTSLTLLPNPANEVVSININNQLAKNGILEIYNLQGKLLKSIHLNVANNAINVQELETGMYICRYKNDTGKQFSSKLIINR